MSSESTRTFAVRPTKRPLTARRLSDEEVCELETRAEAAEHRALTAEARCVEMEQRWLDDDRFDVATEIFAGFVHEARSPLGALVCNLGVLGEVVATTVLAHDPDLAGVLDDARMACQALEHALTRLRACADIGSPPSLGPLPVLVETAGALFRRRMGRRNIQLSIDIEGEPSVWGTPGAICRVLFGLLANATDASPHGGTVRVTGRALDGRVVIWVQDEGPSVGTGNIEHVFSPLDQTTAPRSGIRLAVARALVEQHGGRLTVEVLPAGQRGSRVRLELRSVRPAEREYQHRGGSRAA